LVSSHVYEIMKTIYSTPASESTDAARISVLQNTLSQLRLANIATLDALMTHFTRLIELTSADEAYIAALATTLAPCVLRPRTETSMTMEERYSYRLIRDLFVHKDAIFTELKRNSSLSHSISVDTRPRAISTDESNRKANMEARTRAILAAGGGSRSRAPSPAPSPRGHRRDRSSGGPETRFPIQTSPPADHVRSPRGGGGAPGVRQSLEVPKDASPVVAAESLVSPPLQPITNGSTAPAPAPVAAPAPAPEPVPQTSATYMPGMDDGMMADIGVEKRNSLSRTGPAVGGRFAGRRPGGLNRMSGADQSKRDSVASIDGVTGGRMGVSLTDKAMDD
jgi:hypothetical protein